MTDKNMPKISVILPIYNMEQHLRIAIDSIMNQTLCGIEIICVDDKSTDDSLKIMRIYERADERIKVIALPENSGPSAARNAGIAAARGEYIGFLDPDDYVDPDFFGNLYDVAEKNPNADIIKGRAKRHENDGRFEECGPIRKQILKNKFNFSWTWWSAIYRRGMLAKNNISFPSDVITGEDGIFLMQSLWAAKIIKFSETPSFYHYVRHGAGLDSDNLTAKHIESKIRATHLAMDFINIHDLARNEYMAVFDNRMELLLNVFVRRAGGINAQKLVINAAFDIYKECKYAPKFREYQHFLESGDRKGLLAAALGRKKFN